MTNVYANFDKYFYYYVNSMPRNTTYPILALELTSNSKNMYINFTLTFEEPYLLGLLNKKKDYLVIALRNDTDPSEIILNTTANVFGVNSTQFAIPMQFDYRNSKMQFMRDTAIYLYYVMIGIVVL